MQRDFTEVSHERGLDDPAPVRRRTAQPGMADEPAPVHGLRHREPVQLGDLVRAVAASQADEVWRCGCTLAVRTAPTTVQGDLVLLRRLVLDLLKNAIRHSHEEGRITVSVHGRTLEVSNTGPPVPPQHVTSLMSPRRLPGSGQYVPGDEPWDPPDGDLSYAVEIARAHGATTTADAHPRGGLTVSVGFPECARG